MTTEGLVADASNGALRAWFQEAMDAGIERQRLANGFEQRPLFTASTRQNRDGPSSRTANWRTCQGSQGNLSLTREGGWHTVLSKNEVAQG